MPKPGGTARPPAGDEEEELRMAETFDARLTLLERLAEQQLRVNDQLIEVTARLGEAQRMYADIVARLNQEQALHGAIVDRLAHEHSQHAERLARYDAILTRLDEESARHAERLARLDQILQAIRDMLERGNGRP